MTTVIYSATGCARCNITKRFMKENGIVFQEFDIKADGKDAFSKFYRENRQDIFRDKDGVEFPVFADGQVIRQGVSVVLGYLIAGNNLKSFIGRSELHGDWLDGIDISSGDSAYLDDLTKVLSVLKQNNLKIQATTFGRNSTVLKSLLEKDLVDRVIMEVKGPLSLYPHLVKTEVDDEDIKHSIRLTCSAKEYSFYTAIVPFADSTNNIGFLTPEDVSGAAQLIEEASASKKHPYRLKPADPSESPDERFHALEILPAADLFKYRSAARRHQVMAEIEKF